MQALIALGLAATASAAALMPRATSDITVVFYPQPNCTESMLAEPEFNVPYGSCVQENTTHIQDGSLKISPGAEDACVVYYSNSECSEQLKVTTADEFITPGVCRNASLSFVPECTRIYAGVSSCSDLPDITCTMVQ